MKFRDEGIILSFSNCGENGVIAVVFTKKHGKVRGFVNSHIGLEKGDICYIEWSSRLQEQLGKLKIELLLSVFKTTFGDNYGNLVIQSVCELVSSSVCEKDSHEDLYIATKNCLVGIKDKVSYAIWEILFLKYIGYGLDISECCMTHSTDNLFYISPKTGKAVIKSIGLPYEKKLFIIPDFWKNDYKTDMNSDIIESLNITGYFINKVANEYGFKFSNLYREMLINSIAV